MSILVSQLAKRYGNFQALNGVDLEVRSGELLALLGPSGSGKTTLLRIIAGLDRADTGRVLIDGVDTSTLKMKERQVGFVFQHYALFKHMTVFDNVAFGLTVRPASTRPTERNIEKRVMRLLRLVHLEQFYDRYPHQLSGGQRQRVALARSLAVEPKLLLLDEPFGALDAKVRKELRRWLRRLHEEMHITTIFVTHDQEEAMEVADRVVVMNYGKIEQQGTPEEVYHRPANGFVYDFLGNYNEFAGWRDSEGEIHLAEDDLLEPLATSESAAPSGWMSRYPEITGLFKHFIPRARRVPDLGGAARRMRPLEGTPVHVFARPHEMYVAKAPEPGGHFIPATVIHINPAGSLAKLELQRKNGDILQAEIPKSLLDQLGVKKGEALYVRPKNVRVFE